MRKTQLTILVTAISRRDLRIYTHVKLRWLSMTSFLVVGHSGLNCLREGKLLDLVWFLSAHILFLWVLAWNVDLTPCIAFPQVRAQMWQSGRYSGDYWWC